MERLDYYDILPAGMDAYLSHYGWHFSKAMSDWAISRMEDRGGKSIDKRTYEYVENVLATYGIKLKNDKGYDKVFVYHMGVSDYLGSSIPNEEYLARYVRDVLDDEDGYEGIAFTRFVADCSGKGVPIMWEDMI